MIFFPGRTMSISVSSSSQHLFRQARRARRWSGWSRPWTILTIVILVVKVIMWFRLMRDILASLPGAANSKELHQCIQLFTATALDQVGMMHMMLVEVIMMMMMVVVVPWWRWDWRSWRYMRLSPVPGQCRGGGDGLGLELRVPPRVSPYSLHPKAAHLSGNNEQGGALVNHSLVMSMK